MSTGKSARQTANSHSLRFLTVPNHLPIVKIDHRPVDVMFVPRFIINPSGIYFENEADGARSPLRSRILYAPLMKLLFAPLVLAGLLSADCALAQVRKASPKGGGRTAKTAVKRRAASIRRVAPVDPTEGDNVDGDDLTIRRAAVAALGTQNGSVVVADPTSGRILTIVNQKLALKSGFIPCSTIKLVTALAALSEKLITPYTFLYTARYTSYNLTTALARSNNPYFAKLGTWLGFDRVLEYAQMLGLGEKAALDLPAEEAGEVPETPPPGGVGMMTSFGTGFQMTPLQLAGLLSAVANGGTLYYLQYPRTPSEIENFLPRVKRTLQIAPRDIEDIKMGMRGAVDFGTAKRANDPTETILGKTGTCTDFKSSSHMGWFGSFNEVGFHKLVVVVMLASTGKTGGGVAAGVAGSIYRSLSEQRYFAENRPGNLAPPEVLVSAPCCSQVQAQER
jgi:cell division protein FtsI/penicillin-binding protein 2